MHETQFSRSHFSSKWAFILAAIGSAAGLGNVWRFSYLAYKNGGGTFFLAYFVCLILIGFGIFVLEVGLGQLTGKAAPDAMASLSKSGRYRYFGWFSVCVAFGVLTYYVVITSWAVHYTVVAPAMPWASNSESYFFEHYLKIAPSISSASHYNIPIILTMIAVYLVLFFSIRKGTSGIEKIAIWVTPIPFVLLILLACNSLTLTGGLEGARYLFIPDWTKLMSFNLWFHATSQVFFSLSVGFAIMFAYGSLLDKKTKISSTAWIVIFGDTLVAVLSGIIIFATLGHMALEEGLPIDQVITQGIGLAFVALPKAFTMLPAFSNVLATLFFISLVTLAFTSLVSIGEAIVGGLMDMKLKVKRSLYLAGVCFAAFLIGLLYARSNGLYLLDIVDHFVSGYGITTMVLIESLLLGWVYGPEKFRNDLYKSSQTKIKSHFDIFIKYLIPAILLILIGKNLFDDLSHRYEGYPLNYLINFGLGALFMMVVFAFILTFIENRVKKT